MCLASPASSILVAPARAQRQLQDVRASRAAKRWGTAGKATPPQCGSVTSSRHELEASSATRTIVKGYLHFHAAAASKERQQQKQRMHGVACSRVAQTEVREKEPCLSSTNQLRVSWENGIRHSDTQENGGGRAACARGAAGSGAVAESILSACALWLWAQVGLGRHSSHQGPGDARERWWCREPATGVQRQTCHAWRPASRRGLHRMGASAICHARGIETSGLEAESMRQLRQTACLGSAKRSDRRSGHCGLAGHKIKRHASAQRPIRGGPRLAGSMHTFQRRHPRLRENRRAGNQPAGLLRAGCKHAEGKPASGWLPGKRLQWGRCVLEGG